MTDLSYLTSFGLQTLHNGTTHRAQSLVSASAEAKLDLKQLPNGAIFDPNGSTPAPLTPRPVTYDLMLVYSTPDLAEAEHNTIMDLVGTAATLTATQIDGAGTQTCTARLRKIESNRRGAPFRSRKIKMKLHFTPTDNWS